MSAVLKAPLGTAGAAHPRGRQTTVKVMAQGNVKEVLEKASAGNNADIPAGLNKYSSRITQPKSQGASQAMLYATGLKEGDMSKPQVRTMGRIGRIGGKNGVSTPRPPTCNMN